MIGAVVLAAGRSERMGRPKMLLAWGTTTVLGSVLRACQAAGVDDITVVTGAERKAVEDICRTEGASTVFNAAYAEGEMLSSLQVGIGGLSSDVDAALIVLGDQPRLQPEIVRRVMMAYADSGAGLVVPSYRMHRGHPWLIGRPLWPHLLDMGRAGNARDFLRSHAATIHYVEVDSSTILEDMDTPQDYLKLRP